MLHDALTGLAAGGCMLASDIIGAIFTQAVAKDRGWLAGILDAVGWAVGITTTDLSLAALDGHDLARKAWVIGLVSAANVLGTKWGTDLGARIMRLKLRCGVPKPSHHAPRRGQANL